MPKVTQQHLDSRREQILEAAARCFTRHGFHRASMVDVCSEAGLSAGAVYRYFSGKEQIIEAMCRASLEQYAERAARVTIDGSDETVVRKLAEAFFAIFAEADAEQYMHLSINLWAEALHSPAVRATLGECLDAIRELMAAVVTEAQTRGEIDPGLDARAAASVGIGIFQGCIVQRSLDPGFDVAAYARAATSLMSTSPSPEAAQE